MRRIVMLAVLLAHYPASFSQSPVPRNSASQQNIRTKNYKSHTEQNKPPTAPVAIANPIAAENPKDLGQAKTDKTEPENVSVRVLPNVNIQKSALDYAYMWASVLIAILTLGIAVIALIQAMAAKKSANALMSSERAWMIGNPQMPKFERAIESAELLMYVCSLKNIGRTPARILRTGLAFRKDESLSAIPQTPKYRKDEEFSYNQILLVPHDSFAVTTVA